MDETIEEHQNLKMICPICRRIIQGKFWGGDDYRFGCMNCGYVEVIKIYKQRDRGDV